MQLWPLHSLRQTVAATGNAPGLTSAGHVYRIDEDTWGIYYHGSDCGNLPTEIFHATTTNPLADEWVPDPVWVARREHPYEYDQLADSFYFESPTGRNRVIWSATNNADDTLFGCIMTSNPEVMRLR